MTTAIVVYILIVTLPLVAAAALIERLCRVWSWPVRPVWAAMSLVVVSLSVRAVVQQTVHAQAVSLASTHNVRLAAPSAAAGFARIEVAAMALLGMPRVAASYAARTIGPTWNHALAILWLFGSLCLLTLVCAVYARVWRERRLWKIAELSGQRVRVASHAGPAVIGLFRPEIVVPHWMLESDPDVVRLVIMHEMEHRIARDPLLLAVMWMFVVIIPWHPATWYCLARTRLAIELDCDARVVGRGASLRMYAHLLVSQARARLGAPMQLWLGATSLLESPSHLERRLKAMIPSRNLAHASRPVARYVRTLSYFAIVSTLVFAACESHAPTAADITGLDAASAEANARSTSLFTGKPVMYYVNGVQVSADSARSIGAGKIATLTISRNGPQTIRMFTKREAEASGAVAPPLTSMISSGPAKPFNGLVMVDGVASDASALKSLDPSRIATVEVIKGLAATEQYSDPRAKDGVIVITLKH